MRQTLLSRGIVIYDQAKRWCSNKYLSKGYRLNSVKDQASARMPFLLHFFVLTDPVYPNNLKAMNIAQNSINAVNIIKLIFELE